MEREPLPKSSPQTMTRGRRAVIVSTLGLVQILAWGSTYYLLAVLADPIIEDTGWSRTGVTAGASIGLLAAGAVAIGVGRLIQMRGGRRVLASAMGIIAVGLSLLALAQSMTAYLLAWVVVGIGMGGGLYDAAFATLGRIFRTEARTAIAALTLWGGFASTLCWPLTAYSAELMGWRATCIAYAILHLSVTLPLCLFALPREGGEPPHEATTKAHSDLPLANPRFWILACAGPLVAAMASLWSVHLIAIMQSQGLSLASAVTLGTLIGPAQVGARIIEATTGARHHAVWTMVVSALLIWLGFLGFRLGLPAAMALVGFGAGSGLWSIARGAVPLALFGADDYPTIAGALAMPSLLAAAAAPYVGALLLERLGGTGTLTVLACAATVPLGCSLLLLDDPRRPRRIT